VTRRISVTPCFAHDVLFIAAMDCYVPGILPLGKTFVFLGFLYSGVPLSDLWIAVPNRVDFQSFQISECACSSIPSVKQSVTFWARLNHCLPHRAAQAPIATTRLTPPVAQGRQ